MSIEGSSTLAKGWLQNMLSELADSLHVGTTVEARISRRQKIPSQARVEGHTIELGADCTPVPMLIITRMHANRDRAVAWCCAIGAAFALLVLPQLTEPASQSAFSQRTTP